MVPPAAFLRAFIQGKQILYEDEAVVEFLTEHGDDIVSEHQLVSYSAFLIAAV